MKEEKNKLNKITIKSFLHYYILVFYNLHHSLRECVADTLAFVARNDTRKQQHQHRTFTPPAVVLPSTSITLAILPKIFTCNYATAPGLSCPSTTNVFPPGDGSRRLAEPQQGTLSALPRPKLVVSKQEFGDKRYPAVVMHEEDRLLPPLPPRDQQLADTHWHQPLPCNIDLRWVIWDPERVGTCRSVATVEHRTCASVSRGGPASPTPRSPLDRTTVLHLLLREEQCRGVVPSHHMARARPIPEATEHRRLPFASPARETRNTVGTGVPNWSPRKQEASSRATPISLPRTHTYTSR